MPGITHTRTSSRIKCEYPVHVPPAVTNSGKCGQALSGAVQGTTTHLHLARPSRSYPPLHRFAPHGRKLYTTVAVICVHELLTPVNHNPQAYTRRRCGRRLLCPRRDPSWPLTSPSFSQTLVECTNMLTMLSLVGRSSGSFCFRPESMRSVISLGSYR